MRNMLFDYYILIIIERIKWFLNFYILGEGPVVDQELSEGR
jgi:hypothetical protein